MTRSLLADLERYDDDLRTYIGRHQDFDVDFVRAIQFLSQHSLHLLRSLRRLTTEGFTEELRSADMRRIVLSLRDALKQENGLLTRVKGGPNQRTESQSHEGADWSFPVSSTGAPCGLSGMVSPFDPEVHKPWEAALRPLSAAALAWQQAKEKSALPTVVYPPKRTIGFMSMSQVREFERTNRARQNYFGNLIRKIKRTHKEPPKSSKATRKVQKY